jgi:hypothetical protein
MACWPWPSFFFDPRAQTSSVDFDQPINPGWTFGNLISVTEQNSSAPDTEREIVATETERGRHVRMRDER